MSTEGLSSLDELVLRSRSEQARRHIDEAVRSYKAGAYRASIVMTWVAVVFDFVDKLRELELTGDKNAESKVQHFERIQEAGDVSAALEFENGLLEIAECEFEFISRIERVELERLRADRHQCAHPSMVRSGEKYEPSAELARVHLRNAMKYVLSLQPVQGKAALARLFLDVESEFFPTSKEEASKVLSGGPLARPRPALVRNFFLATLKTALSSELSERQLGQRHAALSAALDMHREICEEVIKRSLSGLVGSMSDDELGLAVRFVARVPGVVDIVPEDVSIRLRAYVAAMPSPDLSTSLASGLGLSLTATSARERTEYLTLAEIRDITTSSPTGTIPEEVLDRLVSLYEEAESYDVANTIADTLAACVDSLDNQLAQRVIQATGNSQVRESFTLRHVLNAVRQGGALSPEEFDRLMTDRGLSSTFPQLMFHPPEVAVQGASVEDEDDIPF